MRHILLTWNPGPKNDSTWTPKAWQTEMVDVVAVQGVLSSGWSVGCRPQRIDPGDRTYLYRQGEHGRARVGRRCGRGILSGIVTSMALLLAGCVGSANESAAADHDKGTVPAKTVR